MSFRVLLGFVLLFVVVGCTGSDEPKSGAIVIEKPVLRATAPGAPVGSGYMVIRNSGSSGDRLVGISTGIAGKVQIHSMSMDGDVMQMREVAAGLEIPAGGEVVLKRGGMHLMFMKLTLSLQQGDMHKVQLTFEKAGMIEVDFKVGDLLGN